MARRRTLCAGAARGGDHGGHAAGAKAATLDALARAGFPVPAAVVLTASTDAPTAAELDALCVAVAGLGAVPLAVRSSAADEDLADSANAGRYTTVLDVWGDGQLRAAVAEVLASATGVPMAVIVQRMVVADASGVAFTANPVTGATGETLVNAVPGLGDRLVSGELTPDEWVVAGDEVRPAAATSSLDEPQVRAVAALARRAADALGCQQDVEWAIDRHGLHLLQARPITTLVEPIPVPVDPPPGFWRRDIAHGRLPRTPMTRSVFDENVGTIAMAAEFGFLVELRTAEIGGWHYAGVQPVGALPGRPAPPGWLLPLLVRLSPVARARLRRCREANRTDLAACTVRRWHEEVAPAFTERIARLRDTDLPGLHDDGLARHSLNRQTMSDRPRGGKDELSRTLHDLRATAGLSTRQAGALAGFSQSKVSRIEQGRNVPTEDDVVAFAEIYLVGERADPAVRRRLVELARDIRAEHRPVVMARSKGRPDVFQTRLARIEAASAHVRSFAPTAVTGLLQTESYMRSLIKVRGLPAEMVDAFVRTRLQRQAGLGDGREYTIITAAAALGWRLGSCEEMANQVSHIADVVGRYQGVHVGVIPWGAAADRLVLHGWDIYDERAVCYGTADATAILTEPRDVARYLELHESIQKIAVWKNEARAVLTQLADWYRAGA